MNSRKYHPYGHALHRRRREEALNELRLSETIAEEEQEEEQEEQKADHEDDCERTNDTILAMLVVLIFLPILNAILMEFVITLLNKI